MNFDYIGKIGYMLYFGAVSLFQDISSASDIHRQFLFLMLHFGT